MNSITNVVITPILHRNINRYMGMKVPSEYKMYNVIKEKFIALHGQEIFSWNLFTGKYE